MRKLYTLLVLSIFLISSCQSLQKVPTPDLIVGTWVLESASYDGQLLTADKMGGQTRFIFTEDGFATFITAQGVKEEGRYNIVKNHLIDPQRPDHPAIILTLTSDQFVVALEEQGTRVVLSFVPGSSSQG